MRRTACLLLASLIGSLLALPMGAAQAGGAFAVTAAASTSSVVLGDAVKFTGTVTPAKAGSVVDLQVRVGKTAWRVVKRAKLAADGTFAVSDRPASVKPTSYRVVMPATKKKAAGYSEPMRVRVYRWHYLSDLDYVDYDCCNYYGETVSINGTIYKESIYSDSGSSSSWTEYNLSRKCSTLKGVMGLTDESETGALGEIEVLGDGSSIYDRNFGLGASESTSINVANVLRIRLAFTALSDDADAYGAIGKAQVLCQF